MGPFYCQACGCDKDGFRCEVCGDESSPIRRGPECIPVVVETPDYRPAKLDVPAGSVQIGWDVVKLPEAGSLIALDGRKLNERLAACECPEFAPFRFPSFALQSVTGCVGPACRVAVTGRTVQLRPGGCWVRVAVTFVGDGEPDSVARGWMLVRE